MTGVAAMACGAALLIWAPRTAYARRRLRAPRTGRPGGKPTETSPVRDNVHRAAATLDLVAACLRAGMPPSAAALTVSRYDTSSLGAALRRSADMLSLGATPEVAWSSRDDTPVVQALAKAVRRASHTGTNLADAVTSLAAELRAGEDDRAQAAAERAGVLIAAPLGLCFLPAFVCLGLVPVIAGLAAQVLGGGLV